MIETSEKLEFKQIADLEVRRSARASLGSAEIKSVLSGSDDWRLYYTIKEVVEHGEIWFANRSDGSWIEIRIDNRWVSLTCPH